MGREAALGPRATVAVDAPASVAVAVAVALAVAVAVAAPAASARAQPGETRERALFVSIDVAPAEETLLRGAIERASRRTLISIAEAVEETQAAAAGGAGGRIAGQVAELVQTGRNAYVELR